MQGTPRNVSRAEQTNPTGSWMTVPLGTPEPPPYLRKVAKEEFIRICNELSSADVLAPIDQAALAVYCQLFELLQTINSKLEIEGLILENMKENPLLKVQSRTLSQLIKLAQQFGLTPRGRGMIKPTPKADQEDELEDFLR